MIDMYSGNNTISLPNDSIYIRSDTSTTMNHLVHKFGIILFIFFSSIKGLCSDHFLEFKVISPTGGFTFGAIHQIIEDSHGFIWFSSHHGLFRYNTETIRKFVNIPSDSNTISSNYITSITKNSKGILWFSSDNGIVYYNEQKEHFVRCTFYNSNVEPLPVNTQQIISGKNNSMWALCDNRLFLMDTRNFTYDRVDVNPRDNLSDFIYLDGNNRLWVKSTTGIVYYSDAPYATYTTFGQVLNQTVLSMLFVKNKLWIGYEMNGANCYDIYGKLIGQYGKDQTSKFNIGSNRVRKIYEDQKGRIWFGTYNGIAVLDNDLIYYYTDKNTHGLMHSSIYDIFTDSKKGIWVSTWSGTLSYANPYDNVFENINSINGLSNNVVSSITEWNGLVLIGTEGGGLNSYNPSKQQINKHTLNPSFNDEQNVKALEIDNNNALWVATFNDGLWFVPNFDQNGFPVKARKVLQGGFYHLTKEGNYIWAASYYNGLYKIDSKSLQFENFRGEASNTKTIHTNHLRTLMLDSEGGLWVGTQTGLCYRKGGSDTFTRFPSYATDSNSLNGNQIYSVFEDSYHTVWIGSSSGLSRFNKQDNTFTHFIPNHGIVGYEIYGITEDSQKHLWISTDKGITEFDLQGKTSRNFNQADGLQGNQFNPGAVFRSAHGKIYFGGPNGLTFFYPAGIKTNIFAPRPVVVGVLINNQLQDPSSASGILHESIITAANFRLKHDQNSITFRFVANNYLNPQKNKFVYRLVNYDDKWISADAAQSATYTRIPPGNYIFQVKAANNDGVWNKVPTEIPFRIEFPWWKKWYAVLAYFIVILIITYYVLREQKAKQQLKNEVYIEKLKSQNEQELNDSKLTFFTNISHEIKTPLSLILSPLEYIMDRRKNDGELTDILKTIQRNGNRLKYLLYQVIDIRRIETGKLAFSPGIQNVVAVLNEIISCFTIEAREREIDFQVENGYEQLNATIDQDKFDKIIFNLLTNAFKFVPDHGEVIVSLNKCTGSKPYLFGQSMDGEYVEIQIFNSGSMIAAEEFESIFERFYQGKENKKRGTGIGLHMVKEYVTLHQGQLALYSDAMKGTCFTVRIPIKLSSAGEVLKTGQKTIASNVKIPDEQFNQIIIPDDSKRNLILIVEDNTELRIFLRKSLSGRYTVVTAPNGKVGLEQATELNPDIIISDVMMPEMSGLELCSRIKNDINTSHIPVILLTALTAEEHQIEGYRSGADAYISKPFSEKLLLSQIDNLLENRQKLKDRLLDPEFSLSETELHDNELQMINKAIAIVEEYLLDTNFTVEILAEKLKMSRTSLHRKLKANTDQSATEFIRFVRLKKALKMLKSGNYTIDEVSYNVGFNTPSYFSQSFKKQFGKSPKEYLGQGNV